MLPTETAWPLICMDVAAAGKSLTLNATMRQSSEGAAARATPPDKGSSTIRVYHGPGNVSVDEVADAKIEFAVAAYQVRWTGYLGVEWCASIPWHTDKTFEGSGCSHVRNNCRHHVGPAA